MFGLYRACWWRCSWANQSSAKARLKVCWVRILRRSVLSHSIWCSTRLNSPTCSSIEAWSTRSTRRDSRQASTFCSPSPTSSFPGSSRTPPTPLSSAPTSRVLLSTSAPCSQSIPTSGHPPCKRKRTRGRVTNTQPPPQPPPLRSGSVCQTHCQPCLSPPTRVGARRVTTPRRRLPPAAVYGRTMTAPPPSPPPSSRLSARTPPHLPMPASPSVASGPSAPPPRGARRLVP
mmetsp:Transcript_1936/g.3930  ORF Transcript_1936/g.3930 Transcript_1936/m.3930 type:complete len:231 (-) Transcript_1936:299-991(-)